MPAAPEAAEAAVVEHLRHLGINLSREAESLRTHEQELALRLRANPRLTVIPSSVAPLALQEWESTAFRIQYPESEQTFRADFARSICHAIALTWCIYEETPQYLEKKSTEFHWKKHYETLVYLRYHGHVHKLKMMQLITDSQQRGLLEKAKQLQATAEKLQAGLDKAADLF
jgi:hypothetical protein